MRCLAIIVATLLLVGIAAGSVVGYRQGYDDGYAAANGMNRDEGSK